MNGDIHTFIRMNNVQNIINNHHDQVNNVLEDIRNIHLNVFKQEREFIFTVIEEVEAVYLKDLEYDEKFKAVEEFLGSPAAERLLNNCPRAWKLIVEYHKNLTDLVFRLELIKYVQLRLNDPMLSIKEKLQLEEFQKKLINYINEPNGLRATIQQLEKQIIQEQQNNPQCFNLLSPLFAGFSRDPQEELKDLLRQNIEKVNKLRETMEQLMERLGNQR